MRNAYKILVGKPEWKRPLWRPRHKSEENMKIDLTEGGCEVLEYIQLAQDRFSGRLL
jgi:hypothetical protein